MRLPPWLRNLSVARHQWAARQQSKIQRASRWPALRSMELEERRVLAVTAIDPVADVSGISEGQPQTNIALATFQDADAQNTHTATVDWGDGTSTQGAIQDNGNGQHTVSGSHTYGDNADYNIEVTVLGQENVPFTAQLTASVDNVDPSLTVPANNSIVVNEGQQVTIGNLGIFTDPGYLDTHTATIDWGDGSPVEAGIVTEANGSGKVAGTHTYGDDGNVTVKVTVLDDDGGQTTEAFTLQVNNVAPTLTVPANNSIVMDEGQQVTIGNLGIFTDPGFLDTHTATVDWGDGSPVEAGIVTEANGSGKVAGTHVYGDNGAFTVKVTVTDDDGGETTKAFTLLVNNVAPSLTVPTDNSIVMDEGQQVTIGNLGIFTDPGFLDTHTATVDWGDGSPIEAGIVTEANGSGKVAGTHVYGDNGAFTVKVTVTDDDGGETTKAFTLLVNNVAPTLIPTGDQSVTAGDSLVLPVAGSFTDPGFLDTHTATVNWGDGSPTEAAGVAQGAGFGSVMAGHVFTAPGVYTVTLRVADDDGGVDARNFLVTVLSAKTPILPPTQLGNTTPSNPALTSIGLGVDFRGGGNEASVLSLYQPIDGSRDLANSNAVREEASSSVSPSALEKRFILVIVYADGTESEPVTLPDSDVSNFPGLWRRLPDNFYRVYQVQENGSLRLVTQGYVQGGLLVDPNDKNETQDRPPTSQKQPDPQAPQITQASQENEPAEISFSQRTDIPFSLWAGVEILNGEAGDANLPLLSALGQEQSFASLPSEVEVTSQTAATNSEVPNSDARTAELDPVTRSALKQADERETNFTTPPASSAALLATALAAGVLVRKQPTESWEQTVDQALERMPVDWSKTKALWRMRKPR